MALFGRSRDINLFKTINRELMGDVITQQCAIYKYNLTQTTVNIYGEASSGRYLEGPYLFNALIARQDQEYPESDLGVDFQWGITFKFLRDDLLGKNPDYDNLTTNVYGANLVPEVGDIIMYNNGYYEVDNTNANQYFVGKNPDYPYLDDEGNNPLENDLANFGSSISIICQTHYVPGDRLNIQKQRL